MRPSTGLRVLVVAALGVMLIVGVFTTLQINANGPITGSSLGASTSSTPTATTGRTVIRATATPARPHPSATVTPNQPVTLNLVSVEQQPSQGGMIVTIDIANHQASPLSFQFAPEYDLQVTDANGRTWPLRWASYAGAPTIASGKTTQLVRAFIAGDTTRAKWPLTVIARHVPDLGQVTWHVDQKGTTTLASVDAPVAVPTIPATGPVSLSLTNVQPNSQLGGVQADLIVRNDQSKDLVFNFDPNSQVSARDSLGRPYNVRWAQYSGVIHVAPHQSVRLARVFLAGPLDNGDPTWVRVTVTQVPGTKPLEAASAV